MDNRTIIARLRSSLVVARMALEQGASLSAHIADGGPTVGEVIERAISLSAASDDVLDPAVDLDLIKEIYQESYGAIAQIHLALTEMDKIDMGGTRVVGIYRIQETAKVFRWCADRCEEFATKTAQMLSEIRKGDLK